MAIAFDTETTGLLRPELTELYMQPSITEIYIAKFDDDFKIVDEFETYLKPLAPISEEVTKITGITNEMVKDAPEFIEIYDSLCDFVEGEQAIFAHNASFDIGMLYNELRRIDKVTKFPWPRRHYCTVELSFPIKNKRMKLGDLYKLANDGKEFENAHRAKDDTIGLISCIKWLVENEFA
jgi:DNA polymerase III epsilon subunit family exonuclease